MGSVSISPNILSKLVNSEDVDFEVDVKGLDKNNKNIAFEKRKTAKFKKKKTKRNPETTGATKSTILTKEGPGEKLSIFWPMSVALRFFFDKVLDAKVSLHFWISMLIVKKSRLS